MALGSGGRALLALGGAALLAWTCARGAPPGHRGPILLLTFEGLRADAVGGLGGASRLTPHLDRLIEEADLATPAVAPSSWLVPSLASLLTGLRPWQHQALHGEQASLPPVLETLAEALAGQGYRTFAYVSSDPLTVRRGYAQGFDGFRGLKRGQRAAGHLAGLKGDADFLWLHLSSPGPPYVRREAYLERLADVPEDLPPRVTAAQLEPYFDPRVPLPEPRRRVLRALYDLNVARADEELGRYLDALRRSGHWDRTLIAVTSSHGQEFGEQGQIRDGGNLGRSLVEVPLVIKLPRDWPGRGIPAPEERPATLRLWATLVQAAGGRPVAAVASSLFQAAPAGVLSELYLTDGANRFSLVLGDHQLHWETRFAPAAPDFYRARLRRLRTAQRPAAPAPGRRVLRQLVAAFDRTPPLSGGGQEPRLELERWGPGEVEAVADPERLAAMARLLRERWLEFVDQERTPAGERARW